MRARQKLAPEDVPAAVATITGVQVQVTSATVRKWCRTGVRGQLLRSQLIGGRRWIDEDDLRAFLDALNSAGAVASPR